jgi:hypothetical protein
LNDSLREILSGDFEIFKREIVNSSSRPGRSVSGKPAIARGERLSTRLNRAPSETPTGLFPTKKVLIHSRLIWHLPFALGEEAGHDRSYMLKQIVAAVLSGMCWLSLHAADVSPTGRERLLLDFGWRFHSGDPADAGDQFAYPEVKDLAKTWPAQIGEADKLTDDLPNPVTTNLGGNVSWVQPGHDDHDWRSLDLPHDWAVELPFSPDADLKHGFKDLDPAKGATIGWYRRTFDLPATDQGKSIWIEFDGVFRNSMVWLNGQCLGRHVSGYTGARYDIGRAAKFGGRNVLVVRVDASRFEGWFYEAPGFIAIHGS